MKLTKHAHACVTLDKPSSRLVVDPGTFTPNAAELVASTNTVLITHEHFDHFDEATVTAALHARRELRVYGPAAVVARWLPELSDQVTAVAEGDLFTADGFEVAVFGGDHALIHLDIPRVANVGFLIEGCVYHPGDSYYVPPSPIQTLLLPTSGPWTKVGEAVDFVRSVRPEQVVQIHETIAMFISPKMLTEVPLTIIPAGESIST